MSELQKSQKLNDVVSRGDKAIIFANGLKGGVGKSALALALVHLYTELYPEPGQVKVVEFDTDNDDVAKACGLGDDCVALDLTLSKSWESFNSIAFEEKYKVLIVNLPAQAEKWLQEHGRDAIEAAVEGKISVATVWALGPVRDSTNSLLRYLRLETGEPVFVARSVFQVDDPNSDFEVFDRKNGSANLRGGSVFDHLKSPWRLRAHLFDGVETEINGKSVVQRYSIARYISHYSASTVGTFYVKAARRFVDGMRKEVGISS
jgi:hypothetical protein